MVELTKTQYIKVLDTNRTLHIVETDEEVEAYYNKQEYAIKVSSPILKELFQMGKLPVDSRYLIPKKGTYFILDIQRKQIPFKGQPRMADIAYVLYKEKMSLRNLSDLTEEELQEIFDGNHNKKLEDNDFWFRVYQLKVWSLFNNNSKEEYGNTDLHQLIGKQIIVHRISLDSDTHTYKVEWFNEDNWDNFYRESAITEALMEEELQKQEAEAEYIEQYLAGELPDEGTYISNDEGFMELYPEDFIEEDFKEEDFKD